ncbi:hypothetical protein [Anaerofustis sp.]|uniref:hypothetical protein n=1 Tax=Anaerofustis sp. TaxID=1872517 RepID=UPI0025BDC26A|nr:hypothetical protein [Anaerofustis sp.]
MKKIGILFFIILLLFTTSCKRDEKDIDYSSLNNMQKIIEQHGYKIIEYGQFGETSADVSWVGYQDNNAKIDNLYGKINEYKITIPSTYKNKDAYVECYIVESEKDRKEVLNLYKEIFELSKYKAQNNTKLSSGILYSDLDNKYIYFVGVNKNAIVYAYDLKSNEDEFYGLIKDLEFIK